MSTTSSCQPPIIKPLGSVTVQGRVNSRVKTLSGAKPFDFSGKVASGVAAVESLFPWGTPPGKVIDKKSKGLLREHDLLFKMLETDSLGALLEDEVGRKCAGLQRELDFT